MNGFDMPYKLITISQSCSRGYIGSKLGEFLELVYNSFSEEKFKGKKTNKKKTINKATVLILMNNIYNTESLNRTTGAKNY